MGQIFIDLINIFITFHSTGNIEFQPKKSTYHHDESVLVQNPELVVTISGLLGVSEETLMNALTSKKARVQGEILVMHYRLPEVRKNIERILEL